MDCSRGLTCILLLTSWPHFAYCPGGGGSGTKEAVKGREFWLAFMRHKANGGYLPSTQRLFLYISNPGTSTVSPKVEFSGLSESPITHTLPPGATAKYVISEEFMIRQSMKHAKSLYVTSGDDVQVQAFYELDSVNGNSAGGFAVLPKASLEREYIVATDCRGRSCVVLVLAVEDGASVKVQLKINGTGSVLGKAEYDSVFYDDGDEIRESLDTGESMQVLCYECDMTGTRVDCNKKVAVFSGGELTSVSGAPGKDLVVEQMMPKKTIGRRYILGSNLAPATEETVKVVTIKDNVRFSFGGDCYTSTDKRQVFTFHRPSNQIVEIIADDQILVAQFIQASGSATPDTVMNLAVPYRQWSTSYEVYVPARDTTDPREFVHLSFLKHRDTILQFTGMQYWEITTSSPAEVQGDYSMVTYEVMAEKLLTVSCVSDCQPFWGFLLHSKTSRSDSITLRHQTNNFGPGDRATYEAQVNQVCAVTSTVNSVTATEDGVTAQTTSAALGTATNYVTTPSDVTAQPTSASLVTTDGDVTTKGDVTTEATSAALDTTDGDVTTNRDVTTEATSVALDTTHGDVTTTDDDVTTTQVTPVTRGTCCRCVKDPAPSGGVPAVTKEEKAKVEEEAKEAIRKELTEDKKTLSSYVRTKESSKDERPSSKFVGYVGIVLFAVVFGFIFGLDAITFVRFLVESRQSHAERNQSVAKETKKPD